MYYFGTLFDKNYLTRGLALYKSMQEHFSVNFTLFVLALDDEVEEFLNEKYDNVIVVKIAQIENKYPELKIARKNRNIVEYYFTLSPFYPLYLLETFKEIDFITTLDADIYFFSDIKPLFDKFQKYSILITAHDFSENLKDKEVYGLHNVSFQIFKRDSDGLKCLSDWKENCLKWCYDVLEDDKFADQKYLDTWCDDYKNVLVIKGEGLGVAPWNVSKYKLEETNGQLYCNSHKLVFYHFHGLRFITKKIIRNGLKEYKVTSNKLIKNAIYKKYIVELSKLQTNVPFRERNIQRINNLIVSNEFFKNLSKDSYYNFCNLYLLEFNFSLLNKIISKLKRIFIISIFFNY